ncbi:MAG: hypothetical protein WC479_10110 [Candidatus Izemoplasmatales bacterium]
MKKYVWFTRYFVIFQGWSNWKIKYRDLFGYSTEWIVKDNTNKLEKIK